MHRYECDGCGKVSTTRAQYHPTNKIQNVVVSINSHKGSGHEEFHLCEECEKRLRDYANPFKWARAPL